MPKIRLSALATDMKGKAGGSVFSTNSGGTYFRNNPSGGGRKSAAWDKSKSSFASLASQWRALTTEQQDAWAEMSQNYPTTNAFGEPRFPSGYELFMRLNGTLINLNLPQLTTPIMPRELPNYGSIRFFTPDQFLFQPQFAFKTLVSNPGDECEDDENCPPEQTCFQGYCLDFDEDIFGIDNLGGINTALPFSFTGIFNLFEDTTIFGPGPKRFVLLSCKCPDNTLFIMSIVKINATTWNLDIEKRKTPPPGAPFDSEASFSFPIENLTKAFRLVANINVNDPENSSVFIDGKALTLVEWGKDGTITNFGNHAFQIGQSGDEYISDMLVQDVRFRQGTIEGDNLRLVNSGYVLGDEEILIDTDFFAEPDDPECTTNDDCPEDQECWRGVCLEFNPGSQLALPLKNEGTAGASVSIIIRPVPLLSQIRADLPRMYSVIMDITLTNPGVEYSKLIFEASSPVSFGKSDISVRKKRIAVMDAELKSVFSIGEAYMQEFHVIPFGSTMFLDMFTLFTTSGQRVPAPPPEPKKPRFKAGALLSTGH